VYKVLVEHAAEKDLTRLSQVAGTKNDWRIRVGDYRVFYQIGDVIRVHCIWHRGEVYR